MQPDDLILISVDDQVVEPPDLFEQHLPEKWRAGVTTYTLACWT
jgi:hypothetical protein